MMIIVNDDFNNVTFFSDELGILNVVVLVILTLKMLILMKMILKLLLMSDLWLGVIDLNNI